MKNYRFGGPFSGQIWLMFEKHCKKSVFQHVVKRQEKANKYHSEGLFSGPSRGYYLGQVKM